MEVVLQGGSGQQKAVGCFKLADDFREFRFLVLDTVGLVDDHVAPVELLEYGLLLHDDLVRCDAHVPFTRHDVVTNDVVLQFICKIRFKRGVMIQVKCRMIFTLVS